MRTLSIINLKGGVAKTISSVNMAHILSAVHGYKVLLIDNDKQGNASKILNRHDYKKPGVAEIMTDRNIDMAAVIQHTDYLNPDLHFCGCFVTQYDCTNEADQQGEEYLRELEEYPLFNTHIRRTPKMKPSTFAREPILIYSSRCGAALDYKKLVEEYLDRFIDGLVKETQAGA